MPAGRPEGSVAVEFTEKDLKKLSDLASVGFTLDQMADYFGISKVTLWRYSKKNKVINETIKKGRARAHAAVGKAILEAAIEDKNITALIWYSKSQMGWKETQTLNQQDTFKLSYADEPLDDSDE